MRRDNQRKKVYRAEDAAFESHEEANERVETVEDIEAYVRYVFGLKRVQNAFPKAMPKGASSFSGWQVPRVGDGRHRRRAGATPYAIFMPRRARHKWVVLHELAHTISLRIDSRIAGHGWEYCETYLLLVRYALGVEAHDLLKASFKKHRVKFRAPRKRRELTAEERAALVERMRKARASRGASEVMGVAA